MWLIIGSLGSLSLGHWVLTWFARNLLKATSMISADLSTKHVEPIHDDNVGLCWHYVHTYIYIHLNTFKYTYIYVYTPACVNVAAWYASICIKAFMSMYRYVCITWRLYIYVYIYIFFRCTHRCVVCFVLHIFIKYI